MFIVCLSGLLALLVYSVICMIPAIIYKRIDYADIAWGGGFIALVAATWWSLAAVYDERLLIVCMVAVWGLRLSWHIWLRLRKSTHVDPRYDRLLNYWGARRQGIGIAVHFLVQAVLTTIIAWPILFYMNYHDENRAWFFVVAGLLIWTFGFIYECVADHQLALFLKEPSHRGHLLKTGLWKYSRHPNYFGEIVQWWSFWVMTLAIPFGWTTFFGPLLITYMIVEVSGVVPNEQQMASLAGFAEYKKKTSCLVPWTPLKS